MHIDQAPSKRYSQYAAPRVSVIVLNFNGANILAKCLDHLLAQRYQDFEILVIDNHSADDSAAIAERYLGCGKLSVVRAARNLGISGGRNLGLLYAQGRVIAFIDNDGYAAPDWLAEAIARLDSDPRIGAVAPVVFFQRNKAILNGAGGVMNYQGYGRDWCFDTPYEFAQLRDRVLYPMGCGMVIRREIFERTGGFDPRLVRYFDDTELGIRVWRAGMQVAVAPCSWVDHEFNYSGNFLANRAQLFEQARLRVALKHYPALRLPRWLWREFSLLRRLDRTIRPIVLRAWLWNLCHLPSVVRARLSFISMSNPLWELMEPFWGQYGTTAPVNLENRPDLTRAGATLNLDGESDMHQLNFGWYRSERDESTSFRWSSTHASALFRLRQPAVTCTLVFGGSSGRKARLVIRGLGGAQACVDEIFEMPEIRWASRRFRAHLPAGDYEVLLRCDDDFVDKSGRRLGVAVSSIRFD